MIDIRIMAHPSRRENITKMLQTLGLSEDIVVWDDRPGKNDAMYTARKAWTVPIPDGCTHRLVLQDDIEICDGFLKIVDKVALKHSNAVVTFFRCEEYPADARYHDDPRLWGCAIMIPVAMLDDLWWFVDNRLPVVALPQLHEIIKHDTTCIRYWLRYRHIPCITTVPSLVQHIGDESLVGIDRRRVAPDYTKTPPMTGW